MNSIWCQNTEQPRFEEQKQEINTEVLIIGGGLAGILCADALKRAGIDYVLAEAERICGGITKNTTAKITYQHGLIYHKMMHTFGIGSAKGYLAANRAALERYRTLCAGIDCDFEEQTAYVYSRRDKDLLEKEAAALRSLGVTASVTMDIDLPFPYAGGIGIPGQAQFHPLKFAYTVAKGLKIHENTKVLEFLPGGVRTNRGKIRARKIVVATHFPILNKNGWYFLKQYQHRSYVLALKNAPVYEGMYVDESDTGMSFRQYGDLLLLGGGGHRTGKQGGGYRELSAFAERHYPHAVEVARWATQDCMTLDRVPYIGQYSSRTPDLYVATGFNKWGITSSMVAAMILADAVQGKSNPYTEVFSPSRSMLRPQLAANALEAAVSLLNPKGPRCPHMGCALKYNQQEHSWDCPCHGSRFSEQGDLLNNPATGDWDKRA